MKLALIIFCAGFFVFGFGAKASAATYYVDGTLIGTCAGGTATSYDVASRNCSASDGTKAYKTIGIAISGSRVAQGDTVYIRSGTYVETDASAVLGAGSGSLTITPYDGESVIIDAGALTNYMWRNPSYDIIIDGGVARSLTFQNSSASLKSIVYLSGGNTTITRTNITDSSIRTTNGWATESGATGSLTMSKNLIHDMAGRTIWATGAMASFILNVTSNQVDTVNGFIRMEQSGVVLNEVNNTIVRGAGQVHDVSYPNVTINAINNIYVIKTNGYLNHLFTITHNPLGIWNFKNNIVWRESITDWQDYSYIIYSLDYLYNIDKSNKFLDPKFTAYGTNYSNANLTLQNITTNYAVGRGLNSNLPVGGDYTGTSWPISDNSVGCFINPVLNPNPYPTLTDNIAFAGDSIMAGQAASDVSHRAYSLFSNISGLTTVNDISGGLAAISGQQVEGSQWLIDRTIFEGAPKTVFISIGINNMNNGTPTLATNSERAQGVKVLFDKLIDAGITPIWLGVESKIGNPPDNTASLDFNNKVSQICNTESMSYGSIFNQMIVNNNWKTDYYADLTTNVHPNNAGHALIAELAEYLYFTNHTIGTDHVNIGAGARVYADGKFRDLGTANASTATLSITPTGGAGAFNSSDKSHWLDITNLTWSNSGNHHKTWTESSTTLGSTQTLHTIGDLEPNKYYNLQIDSSPALTNITGPTCNTTNSLEVCQADSNGKITFTYTGGYSTHTFDIQEGDNTPPIVTDSITPKFHTDTTEVTLSLTTDENSTCHYGTNPSDSYAAMTSFTNTNSTTHTTVITNLTPNTYTYYAKCLDSNTNETTHTLNFEIAQKENDQSIDSNLKINSSTQNIQDKHIYSDNQKITLKGQDDKLTNGEIKIYKDSHKWKTLHLNSNGEWNKDLNLKDNHSTDFKIIYYDQYGTELDSDSFTVNVDTQKPTFTNPLPTTINKNQPINFEATDNQKVSYYKIKILDNQGHILRNRKQIKDNYLIPVTIQSQAETIIVRAYDKAGNYQEQRASLI